MQGRGGRLATKPLLLHRPKITPATKAAQTAKAGTERIGVSSFAGLSAVRSAFVDHPGWSSAKWNGSSSETSSPLSLLESEVVGEGNELPLLPMLDQLPICCQG